MPSPKSGRAKALLAPLLPTALVGGLSPRVRANGGGAAHERGPAPQRVQPGRQRAVVIELMQETLEHFLQDNRGTLRIPQEKQVSICLQIASGLLFLHQHDPQILHRDWAGATCV